MYTKINMRFILATREQVDARNDMENEISEPWGDLLSESLLIITILRIMAKAFTDFAVGPLLVAAAMVTRRGRAVLFHGLLGAVIRVVQVKAVTDVTEEPRSRSPRGSGIKQLSMNNGYKSGESRSKLHVKH